ncbi:LysR family transcriptional regulator [Motilibacter rhizosphaerae]|uniref:LysR family transcriptional regulator n=1 Tax=Motilibacter rhizosphaerae TaxID=598652 RepID=A0A4Q7NSH2_9ACTN|nr:LysR family transcriptional regulator [Motilibacter rhizosphaerae]RZS90047.1 LysR family transcriptional regulator [Motilibacter rhizosphaerae]
MERRQLEYVVAVADDASFTRAARRLHVAQPGISAQVALLEKELGERIFDRDARGVALTPVGELVVERARGVLQAFDDVRTAGAEARGLVRGAVTIGTVRGVPLGSLAASIAAFRSRHPGIDVRLVEDESAPLLAGLADGGVDLALVALAGDPPAAVVVRTQLDDRLAVAVPPDDPWARRRRVRLEELAERSLVGFPPGAGARDALDAAAGRAGVRLRVAFEAGTVASVVELARAGLGPAVVPETVVRTPLGEGLHGLSLAPAVRSRLALAWRDPRRRTPSPAARALLAAVLRPAAAHGERDRRPAQ